MNRRTERPQNLTDHAHTIPLMYRIATPLMLALATVLAYLPSLSYDFQFDDIANITKHFEIRHHTLRELFFHSTRWISYWLNSLHYGISKFNPLSYRIGNLAIHTTNGILVFFITLLILGRLPKPSFFKRNAFAIALLTAALFLLHPVQTQTVSYVIQGQLEGMAALCTFGMTLCFLNMQYAQSTAIRYSLIPVFFLLAILSTGTKEITIVIPLLVALVDWFFVARASWEPFKQRLWFHILTAITIFGMYLYLLKPKFFMDLFGFKMTVGNNIGNVITQNPSDVITSPMYFISQFKVILHYLWIFIWPLNISVEYDWVLSKSFFYPDCFFPFLALVALGFTVYALLRKNPTSILAFGMIWFGIAIAPRSSILPSPELLVDYKTYQASLGWLLIIAMALIKLIELLRNNKTVMTFLDHYKGAQALLVLLIATLGFATQQRNTVWRSGIEFWANIVENAPGKARAYNNYGVELSQRLGKFADAIPYFKHAISMDAGYRDPYNNLAVAYAATHQIDMAIETLQKSLKINAYYPEAYNNIASFLIEKRDFEKAKQALDIAIQLRPYYGKAYFNLGRIHLELGEREQALACFKKACTEADLDNEAGFLGYAKCCMLMERFADALDACKKALESNPNSAEAEFSMGNCYYMLKQYDEAAKTYEHMLSKDPQDAKLWYNLAEAHLGAGRATQALSCYERLRYAPGITPTLFVRIAACYEMLKDPVNARKALMEVLDKNLCEADRKTVQNAIAKLNQQYKLA